ncbi:LacI family DNA-binding transcriptional regulator [Microbacterium sp. Se5.02b]|uniref:LacI family DNA-binding transcriptional regulator n=1 Tax=Microbacterium sp. Se5.02b TaxID=2864103 RepID=UPI001C688921|nr:LacI family DNA-binding transcriptional regulator [Microbacterium sp. Se5.02b]QYM64214.1 LacI family transcriptional regulator [Microbacterium sp. Se5.02b]
MVTQMDVARRAGVARRTVSNVVTGFPYVSDDVRARVQRAIEELGYVPNHAARQLRTGRSDVVALIIPEVGVGYFGELCNLIVEEAAAHGMGTVVAQTHGSRSRELAEIERVIALQPDGMIASPLELTPADIETISARISLALIGEHFAGTETASIAIDNVAATTAVVEHLIRSGRERIAYVGVAGPAPRFNELRRTGYLSALSAAELPAVAEADAEDFTTRDGYDAGMGLVRRIAAGEDIDAVFCVTDEVAIGVLRALHDGGLRVPADIAVAGFDDITEGRYSTPRLTTVSPDKHEIARRAVASVRGEVPRVDAVAFTIEERESSQVD